MVVRDSNGTELKEGDKRHPHQGSEGERHVHHLEARTMVRGIHLTDDPAEVECRVEKIKGLVLRTEFLKKA